MLHSLLASPEHDTEALYFPITSDSSLTAALKDTLLTACGSALNSLNIESIPQKHQSRIWLVIQAHAFGVVLHAVIANIPEAELGPVVHIH